LPLFSTIAAYAGASASPGLKCGVLGNLRPLQASNERTVTKNYNFLYVLQVEGHYGFASQQEQER